MTDTLRDFIESAGFDVRSYSGRGMYGKVCLAVSVDYPGSFFVDVTREICRGEDDDNEQYKRLKELKGYRTDQLGLGQVVYWPNVPFDGEDDDA